MQGDKPPACKEEAGLLEQTLRTTFPEIKLVYAEEFERRLPEGWTYDIVDKDEVGEEHIYTNYGTFVVNVRSDVYDRACDGCTDAAITMLTEAIAATRYNKTLARVPSQTGKVLLFPSA